MIQRYHSQRAVVRSVAARIQAKRFQRGKYVIIELRLRRSISIIIPAYNEEKRLPASLEKIKAYLDSQNWDFCEVVVVNDGSRDATEAVARTANARVLANPGNRGKGYSVRHGMLEARGEWA